MDFVDKVKEAVAGHSEEAKQVIEQVGDFVDQHTEGKFTAQVDQAQDFLKGQVSE